MFSQAAQLHDVGKSSIPDAILQKPGKLNPQEFEIIQKRCNIGSRIMNPLIHEESICLTTHTSVGPQIMGSTNSPVLRLAAVIAATHHEKWDGSGYPKGWRAMQFRSKAESSLLLTFLMHLARHAPTKKQFRLTDAESS
ncbi:MAG: hypothetical protein CMM05_00295 [Rhodopirellula sp.]|nr:hypothetical protein [Rhodopirellula sp.]